MNASNGSTHTTITTSAGTTLSTITIQGEFCGSIKWQTSVTSPSKPSNWRKNPMFLYIVEILYEETLLCAMSAQKYAVTTQDTDARASA